MKIGYDAKRAVQNNTGLGNYSRLVLQSIARSYPDDRLIAFAPSDRENPRLKPLQDLNNISWFFPGKLPLGSQFWRSWGISKDIRRSGLDIFHGLSNELPLNIRATGVKSVLTMHDLIYRRLPDDYSLVDRTLYDWKYGWSCRNADRIIAISECTKRDIVEIYGVAEDKIDVIYQGCDAAFSEIWSDERKNDLRKRYNLPNRFIVQIGTIERRKNLELTVRSLAGLDSDISLVVIGRPTKYKDHVVSVAERSGVDHRVIFLENVPFGDLPGFNQSALVAAYPSRYEGFGLPVIEALSGGTPVVAAKGSCLEEAGGPGALYVSPDSPSMMASTLRAVIEDPELHRRLSRNGINHVGNFATIGYAEKVHHVYEDLLL